MKKLFLFLMIAISAISLQSCKLLQPVQIVPPYNAAIVADQVELGKFVDGFFIDMESGDDKSFETNAAGYSFAEVSINSIIIRSGIRPKSAPLVRQAELYKKMLLQFRDEHKVKGFLNDSEIRVYKRYLQDQLAPLIDAEMSLK